jgi:hypothetical protein
MINVLKEKEWEIIKNNEIFSEIENDRVLDFIAMFSPKQSSQILKALEIEGGLNIAFKLDDESKVFYGFIHKFNKKNDTGLILIMANNTDSLSKYVKKSFHAIISEPICKQILTLNNENNENNAN